MRQPEHLGLVMLAYVLMSGTTGTLGAMYGTVLHSPGRCCGLHWSTGQLRCSTLWGEELADLAGKSLPASMSVSAMAIQVMCPEVVARSSCAGRASAHIIEHASLPVKHRGRCRPVRGMQGTAISEHSQLTLTVICLAGRLRISCSMKLVSQRDGENLDPNWVTYKKDAPTGGGPAGPAGDKLGTLDTGALTMVLPLWDGSGEEAEV